MGRFEEEPTGMASNARAPGFIPPPIGTSGIKLNPQGVSFTSVQKILAEHPKKKDGTFSRAPSFLGFKPMTCKKQQAKGLGEGA